MLHSFLTSAVDGSELSTQGPVAVPVKEPPYPLQCRMVGFSASLYLSVERKTAVYIYQLKIDTYLSYKLHKNSDSTIKKQARPVSALKANHLILFRQVTAVTLRILCKKLTF